jgi:hypothetical protein
MTTRDPNAIDLELARGLRERAADVGGEDEFYRQILSVAVATPQRRRFEVFGRRTLLVLAAALLGVGVVGASIGGPVPTKREQVRSAAMRNGAILVADEGRMRWIDPDSGAPSSTAGLPSLPNGTDSAAWSRDGGQLAVVVNGDLAIIDPIDGKIRVVAECAVIGWECTPEDERGPSFAWSPDGTTIAFTAHGLHLLNVGTGAITVVIDDGHDDISSPSWSPDGRWIAFEYAAPYQGRYMGALREIHIVQPDGSQRHSLSGPPIPESIGFYQPVWSVDGTRVIYLGSDVWKDNGDPDTDGWALKLMAIELAGIEPIGSPVALIDLGRHYCLGFCPRGTLAPDAANILIDDGDGLIVARLDGTGRRSLGVSARPLAWQPVP